MPPFDDIIDPHLTEYVSDLQRLTQQALDGEIAEREFIDAAEALVIAAFMLAFLVGRGDPERLEEAIAETRQRTLRSVRMLADDIFSGRYSRQEDDGKIKQTSAQGREKLANRLTLWGITLAGVYHLGKLATRDRDARYTWRYRPEKKHCDDCRSLNGVTLTAAEWDEMRRIMGIYPQSNALECAGFYCGCRLDNTTKESAGLETVLRRGVLA